MRTYIHADTNLERVLHWLRLGSHDRLKIWKPAVVEAQWLHIREAEVLSVVLETPSA